MTPSHVNKIIREMRQYFAFFGVLMFISGLLSPYVKKDGYILWVSLATISFAVLFFLAFLGLGKRSRRGYTLAKIASFALFVYFPFGTLIGMGCLANLSQPEVKQAFGIKVTNENAESPISTAREN